jgi:hypothetical protein
MTTLQDFLDSVLSEGKNANVPQPEDCKNMSVDTIVAAIFSQVNISRDNGNTRNDAFYAGICKDVEDNMKRHGNDSYVALVDCGTREKAGEVETKLGELKFDVGEKANNGGDEETTIVYVIKKDRNFKR